MSGALFLLDIAFMLVIIRQGSQEYRASLRNASLLEQRAAQLELTRERAEAAVRPDTSRLAGLRALVVEEHLALSGSEATIVDNSHRALACLAAGEFDLVLMDCEMPELDGLETTRRQRAVEVREGLPRIPIIALTANAGEGDRHHALDAGMDDVVTKPLAVATLHAAIDAVATSEPRAQFTARSASAQ